ncbi:MFS general substrate transporter [Dacryopinax primogenitus]|uniref:MFS general substrate transporter n=1 Tax=Dacryopinax primogenitus (strain DJM 731) TaxID=1858805 RepID=M5G988_DACPD|nr:MFS general substrate transporter [Dacryopinax primogenitus]EJU05334.1 MFS general substrate transporter [Dacryopinax primogenitus]
MTDHRRSTTSSSHLSIHTGTSRHLVHRAASSDSTVLFIEPSGLASADGGCDTGVAESFVPNIETDLYEQLVSPEEERLRMRHRGPALTSETAEEEAIVEDSPEETTSLLNNGDDDDDDDFESRPWYRRPSPWWLIPTLLVSSTLTSMTLAPKVEVYNKLVCAEHRPEYSSHDPPILIPGAPEEDVVVGPGAGPVIPAHFDFENAEDSAVLPNFLQEPYRWKPEPPDWTRKGAKSPSALCRADPLVQAEVAKISTAMTTLMGLLAVLTTGFWSSKSDVWGRTRILALSIAGVLVTDANFLLVAHASEYLPGGYRFLIVGPVIDGLVGGMPTATAAAHAYVGDSTPPEARGRMFSLYAGLIFTGIAIGPSLGSLLIKYTDDLLSVFYLTTLGHILYAIAITLFIPESLSSGAQRRIAKRNEVRRRAQLEEEEEISRLRVGPRGYIITAWRFARPLFGFLAPLQLFAPTKVIPGQVGYAINKFDWNLTFMATCYGVAGLMIGLYTLKFQYAQKAFGWDAQKLGYWLSLVGCVRAFHLVVILPLLLKLLRPKPEQPISLPLEPSEPLQSPGEAENGRSVPRHLVDSVSRAVQPGAVKHRHSPRFDLHVARASLGIELLCELGQASAPGPASWTAATLLGAFGGGYSPAMQSLALGLLKNEDETGRLFGAMSVMSALCTQVMGPALFGLMFAYTVGVFPKMVFVAACVCAGTALICLFCIRIPKPTPLPVVIVAPPSGSDRGPIVLEGEPARRIIEGEPCRGRTMSRGNGKAKTTG